MAACLVARNPVAVDEPLKRRPPVDLISVRCIGDAAQTHTLVDAQDRLFVVIESHCSLADSEMLRSRLTGSRRHDVERIFCAGLVAEMQFRKCAPGLSEGLEIRSEGNPRQSLYKIIGEALSVAGFMENTVDIIEYCVLVDGFVLVIRTERGQRRI